MNSRSVDLSIVVPFFYGERFIHRLCNSFISANLLKDHDLLVELILVLDSPVNTLSEIEGLLEPFYSSFNSIIIIQNESTIGVAASRNRGLEKAVGTWIYFIDQDDEITSFFPSVIKRVLHTNLEFVLMNGVLSFERYNNRSHTIYFCKPKIDLKSLIQDEFIRSPGQVLMKREVLSSVKFPEPKGKNKGSDDRFCWILLFAKNQNLNALYIHEHCYKANIHLSNSGSDSKKLWLSSLDFWEDIEDKIPSFYYTLVKRNKLLLRFRLGHFKKMVFGEFRIGIIEYLSHSFNVNRILGYLLKRYFRVRAIF